MDREIATGITLLRVVSHKSYGFIAEQLGIPVNTVKSFCQRHGWVMRSFTIPRLPGNSVRKVPRRTRVRRSDIASSAERPLRNVRTGDGSTAAPYVPIDGAGRTATASISRSARYAVRNTQFSTCRSQGSIAAKSAIGRHGITWRIPQGRRSVTVKSVERRQSCPDIRREGSAGMSAITYHRGRRISK